MPNYRRAREGNTYFFTVVTYQRRQILCLDKSRQLLREAIHDVRESYPFLIEAWVLLPEHMHCIWKLPDKDTNFSIRWALIKKEFTKKAKGWLDTPKPGLSQQAKKEGTIWQRRFWEHMIRDERDFKNHCDYIHFNPVKHGLAKAPQDWPHSTFHSFVKKKIYPADWGTTTEIEFQENIGHE